MEEQLKQIINHYGINKQLKYIHSEYFELDEAIIDHESYGSCVKPKDHIAEEIADVMVMLKQFQYYYGIEDYWIEEIMKKKIERQLKRIEEECKEQETKQNLKE